MSGQAPVAHSCNPSYYGGRDLEDHGSKPVLANSLRDPISKIPITHTLKRAGGVTQTPVLKKRKRMSRNTKNLGNSK
jgi:hypothetical protein